MSEDAKVAEQPKSAYSSHVPPVPTRLPKITDTVCFVLKPLGKGVECWPKIRPAIVTEDWSGREKHPTGRVPGPDGKVIVELADGQVVLYDARGIRTVDEKLGRARSFVPAGCVNLYVHLDGFARHDHNEGHVHYEGNVRYDPEKSFGTWHWPGE